MTEVRQLGTSASERLSLSAQLRRYDASLVDNLRPTLRLVGSNWERKADELLVKYGLVEKRYRALTYKDLIKDVEEGLMNKEIAAKRYVTHPLVSIRLTELKPVLEELGLKVKRRGRKFTDEQLIEDIQNGSYGSEVARKYGVTPTCVCIRIKKIKSKLEELGIDITIGRRTSAIFSDEDLLRDIEKGLYQAQIARKYGVDSSTVWVRVKKIKQILEEKDLKVKSGVGHSPFRPFYL